MFGGDAGTNQLGWRCFHASLLLPTPLLPFLLALHLSIILRALSFPTSVLMYRCMVALERTTVLSQCCPPVRAGKEGGREKGMEELVGYGP